MTEQLRFKVGDTIYWYCNDDDCVHHAEVQFVNFAKAAGHYIDVNYEVETFCRGQKRTVFVDDEEAEVMDLSA